MRDGTSYALEVNPRIPRRLARLEELANNLWYTWDRPTRALFARLHTSLWDAVGHSPKALLRRIDEQRLVEAAADPVFLASYNRVCTAFDTYMSDPLLKKAGGGFAKDDLVAYFCAEFGLHESLPIYSGGLGILSGDHCKAASDTLLPFVAVGLLYRQGYFVQTIDNEGNQRAQHFDSDFEHLPITPVVRNGAEMQVELPLPGRTIRIKVWEARVGRVSLYLLDTDLSENSEHDRDIAHQLYGGDRTTRMEQEIVLGAGGVRALAALGLRPTVWHINEGHAAFMILERIRLLVLGGANFDAALEAVAANTVFTTHTPVPAGHDQFNERTIGSWLQAFCAEIGVPVEKVESLGRPPTGGDFNMTNLAVRGTRYHNAVSRIHGRVSSQMLRDLWPEVPEEENPITYVTNGVHISTFLAPEWMDILERFVGSGWPLRLGDPDTWDKIRDIPDHIFWSVRQYLKAQMLHLVRHRIRLQHFRNAGSESHLDRLLNFADPADPNVLTIGFARRFATYKRATLLFNDPDRLKQILCDPARPVLFIFCGKAHPQDQPGQDLIRHIARVSRLPEFEGKILLLEGYDLHVARRLVSGCDVWLNNPVYPLEACGTSGMKAGMNGTINLSVLDGWWAEGYERDIGWAIKPASSALDPERRDREEARTLYEILQDRAVPMYYQRTSSGYSPEWIHMAKRSMAWLLPRFNAVRMLNEYVSRFYLPASKQGRRYAAGEFEGARVIAEWKSRARAAWPGVTARRLDTPSNRIQFGDSLPIDVAVRLNGLTPDDVAVELLLARGIREQADTQRTELAPAGEVAETGEHRFTLDLKPELCGRMDYRIRVYPRHVLLTHPLELGLMRWV